VAPGGHGHQWPCGLDGIQEVGIKEGETVGLRRESDEEASLQLLIAV
jgi:hypothetical protein